MIWVMAVSFLRMDRAKLKWKIKLEKAFVKQQDKLACESMTAEMTRHHLLSL